MGDLWIRGGTVVTAERSFPGDVIVRGGRIEAVVERQENSEAAKSAWNTAWEALPVLDAAGKFVLPGLIDVHVHFRDPGLTHKEDFFTGTRAAANGGVTTALDMPNTLPPVANADILRAKMNAVRGRAWIDYGFYGLIDEDNLEELSALAEAGAVGFKLFLGPTTGDLRAPGWGRLIEVFESVRDIGLPLVIHAEDRDVIEYWTRGHESRDHKSGFDYRAFLATRPRFGEVTATQTACLLAQMTGTPIHIAHVALEEAVEVIRQAKAAGAPVTAETCPPFLTMTADDCQAAGPVAKMLPPVREQRDRDALWAGLRDGTIDLIATDHAPHEPEAKAGGWLQAAGGMAGVETMLPVLLTEVHRGRLSLNELVRWTSREPARVFGLQGKGQLQPGFDGDIVIVNMEAEVLVTAPGSLPAGSLTDRSAGGSLGAGSSAKRPAPGSLSAGSSAKRPAPGSLSAGSSAKRPALGSLSAGSPVDRSAGGSLSTGASADRWAGGPPGGFPAERGGTRATAGEEPRPVEWRLRGKSANTPLLGRVLKGVVTHTVLRGRIVIPGVDTGAEPGGIPVKRVAGTGQRLRRR